MSVTSQDSEVDLGLEVRVLGPVSVWRDGRPVELSPQQRRLVAALVVGRNGPVSVDRLLERTYGDAQPGGGQRALHTAISRLRSALGERSILTEEPGYRLAVDDAAFDVAVFERSLEEATAPELDAHQRLVVFDKALRAWRGPPFEDLAEHDWVQAEIERLSELRLVALERRYESMLAAGMHTDVLPGLGAEVEAHPLRERLVGLQMLALFRAGRQVEATRVFQSHRDRVGEGLGLEPGQELVELDRRIVAGDPSLHLSAPVGRPLRGYRLGEQLGEGAFAVVLRGTQPSVGRDVAVKIIRSELANRPEFVRRFEAEAHLVARLEHPHIVPLYDYWREPGRACLVFRYLRGGTLEARLTSGGGLSLDECTTFLNQVGTALDAAHRAGVVHRDVKPANVFLDEAGNFYLGDFGIALEASELSDPTAALSAGSPAYAAPEQLRREHVGPAADVHGLGISLYEALTGRLPFPSARTHAELLQHQLTDAIPAVSDQRHDVPRAVDDVLATATAKDPADRYQHVGDLIAAFQAALIGGRDPAFSRAGAVTAVRVEARNPYKGLRAFSEADADDFFGRERLVDRLVDIVSRTGTPGRIAAVVGPSGIGKSSVVRAGLVPVVRNGVVPGSDRWFVTTMMPGRDPFDELAAALIRVATSVPDNLMGQLSEDHRGIARIVKAIAPDEGEILVVIDQFEELFTTVEDPSVTRRFLDALEHAATDARCPLRVVLTMRADFWDRPLRHGSFARMIESSTVHVTALAPDELERAIVTPAHRAGCEFEPGLVSEIVADITDQPGALPLLQFALTELWERRVSELLTRDAYHDLGGVAGALTRRAEELYQTFGPPEQLAVRQLFSRLVTPGEGSEDTRRRAHRRELVSSAEADNVIDRFGEARLLSFDTDHATSEPTVEVAHEALIRQWPRLRSWLDEDRDGLRILRHLSAASDQWAASDEDEGELYRGGRLETAERWAADNQDMLTESEAAFLSAGIVRREEEATTEQRRLRRLRALLATVAAIAVIASIAGTVAFQQRSQANQTQVEAEQAQRNAENNAAAALAASEEATAQSELAAQRAGELDVRRLIAESANQIDVDRRRGLLLALEAYAASPTAESLGAIQRVLVGAPTNWLGTIGGPQSTYHGVAFAAGRRLAGAGPDGVDLIALDTRAVEMSIPFRTELSEAQRVQVAGVKVDASADGTVVAVTSPTGEWQVLDSGSGTLLADGVAGTPIKAMDLTDDGTALALGLTDGTIHIVTLNKRDGDQVLETGGTVDVLSFDSAGRRLAAIFGVTQPGQIWDTVSGQRLVEELPSDVGSVGVTALAWQGDLLVLGGRDRTMLFDPDTSEPVVTDLGVTSALAGRIYTDIGNDGALVLTGNDGWVELLGPDDVSFELVTDQAQVGQPEDIAYDSDLGLVALAGSTGVALVSTLGHGVLVDHRLPLAGRAPQLTEDGRRLVSTSSNPGEPPLEVWVLDDGARRLDQLEGYAFGLSRQDEFLVVGPDSDTVWGTVAVLDGGSPAPIEVAADNFSFTYALSPDGRFGVVSTIFDGRIQVFERASGQVIAELDAVTRYSGPGVNQQARFAPDLEFHPDGHELVVTLRDAGQVVFYDTSSWTESRDPIPAGEGFFQIDFTSDGSFALTVDYERGLELRSASTYEVLRGPDLPLGSFARGAQNPEILVGDRYAVVGGESDGTIIWDIEAWAPVGVPFPFESDFRPMAVASKANLIAGVLDEATLVWNVDVAAWPELACLAAGRNLTLDEWEAVGPDIDYRSTCPQWQ